MSDAGLEGDRILLLVAQQLLCAFRPCKALIGEPEAWTARSHCSPGKGCCGHSLGSLSERAVALALSRCRSVVCDVVPLLPAEGVCVVANLDAAATVVVSGHGHLPWSPRWAQDGCGVCRVCGTWSWSPGPACVSAPWALLEGSSFLWSELRVLQYCASPIRFEGRWSEHSGER